MTAAVATLRRAGARFAKIPAFLRRDLLTEWSYRTAFIGDVLGLATQAVMFYFVGLMVDPAKLPEFGGSTTTYLEFVAIGIAMFMFVQVCLTSVAGALREEQYMGTLESLMLTAHQPLTVADRIDGLRAGLCAAQDRGVPRRDRRRVRRLLRHGGHPAGDARDVGVVPSWGLGILAGAATLTLKRGGGSSAHRGGAHHLVRRDFPIDLLPGWLQTLAEVNPFTIALDAMRGHGVGGAGWGEACRLSSPAAARRRVAGVGYACYTWALRGNCAGARSRVLTCDTRHSPITHGGKRC